jgi:hypothetical protein
VSPDSPYHVPSTSQDTSTVSKTGPTIVVGYAKAHDSKVKPASRVKVAQSNQSKEQSDTKGHQQLAHPEPHRGDPAFSSFVSEF